MNWEYLAGFFDGEGNVNINKITKQNGKFSYAIQLRIYNSEEKVLLQIKKFINIGQIYKVKRLPATNYVYELTITNKKDVKFFLDNIVDKLIIKQEIIQYILSNFSFERNNNNNFDLSFMRNLNQRNKGNIIKAVTE